MSWQKVLSIGLMGACLAGWDMALGKEAPPDRVVVMYFHRTQRCPTCLRMESYAREAILEGFPEQVNEGKVAFYSIDFQDEKNSPLARSYGVQGPMLVVVKVVGHKGVEYVDLKEIWTKAKEKKEFFKYVQHHVARYLPK